MEKLLYLLNLLGGKGVMGMVPFFAFLLLLTDDFGFIVVLEVLIDYWL
jgi:hypothetical protein